MHTTVTPITHRGIQGAIRTILVDRKALQTTYRHAKARLGVHRTELARKFYTTHRQYSHYDRGRDRYWLCVSIVVQNDFPLTLNGTEQMRDLLRRLEKDIKRQLLQMDIDVQKVSVRCGWQMTQYGEYAQLYATIWHKR